MVTALLNTDLVHTYREHGYVVLDDIYNESELNDIEAFFEDYRANGLLEGSHQGSELDRWRSTRFEEVDRTKQQVRALHPHRFSDKILRYYLHPNVAAVLAALFGKPAFGAQTMYYYKPPGSKGQGMHQDNFYLLAQPATCAGAWTPIDDADEENGCLYVVPGSHHDGLYCPDHQEPSRWLNYGDSHITRFPRDRKPIPLPVRRGQTVFFHGQLIHGSGPNRSKTRWRRTFIGHYVDEATTSIAKFYHPILDMQGNVVSRVEVHSGGGPCGDGWSGAVH